MQSFVLSFITDDRPGIVHELADAVASHGGNWLESRMIQLDGKFAGLARISVPEEGATQVVEQLKNHSDLNLIVEHVPEEDQTDTVRYTLDIVGNDRPGIIFETTRVLAEQSINLIEIASHVAPAPMSGIPMFNCSATIGVASALSPQELEQQLNNATTELGVDIHVEEYSGG
ncbi:MAG: ACT domain-containing protein [Pseudomonadota bacterium]